MKTILGIIGFITCLVYLYKAYRYFFGYSYDSCPNDHDTMARQGATYCKKCKNEL
jgi:radical SAM superfamily enzyme